jgi:hypothetical protein
MANNIQFANFERFATTWLNQAQENVVDDFKLDNNLASLSSK